MRGIPSACRSSRATIRPGTPTSESTILAVISSRSRDESVREIPVRTIGLLHADVFHQNLLGQDPILAGHHADGLSGRALRMQEGERAFQHRERRTHEYFLTGIHLSEYVDCLLGVVSGPFER